MNGRIRIEITKAMRDEAMAYERAVLEKIKGYGPSYTGFELPGRYYDGPLGELCFKVLLDRMEMVYDHVFTPDGKADSGDFIVYYQHGDIIMDMKAGHFVPKSIMLKLEKLDKDRDKKIMLYVAGSLIGARYDEKCCFLIGWNWFYEVAKAPLCEWGQGPTHTLHENDQRPLRGLFDGTAEKGASRRATASSFGV